MFRYGFRKNLLQLGVDYESSVLAAVSGGVDSMCMLDALVNSSLNLKVTVAHVNFNLRGEESDADTQLVINWCKDNGVELLQESFDTTGYAKEKGISIEMAARELRYEWFYKLMDEKGFDFLAIAHNANDNAETLLLNLTRGCGIEGIGGIKEKVKIKGCQDKKEQYIIRPLMVYNRKQIEKYALKFKVPFRVDSTNLVSDYSRNRIRNEVFPQLERINPSVTEVFNRNIRHFAQAENVLQKLVSERLVKLAHKFNCFKELYESKFSHTICSLNLRMNCADVKDTDNCCAEDFPTILLCIIEIEQLLKEVEWEFWLYNIIKEYCFSTAVTEAICNSIVDDEGTKRFLSANGEFVLMKERGLLKVYSNVLTSAPLRVETNVIAKESWRTRKEEYQICPTLYIDAKKIEMPLCFKCVEAGERFKPLGLKGSKKVTDYLTDIKFENIHKSNVVLMCDATGKIVCIPGLQISDDVKVTESTTEVLQIKII